MKILITGGCGFVGTNISLYLHEAGHEVICVDNMMRRGTEINLETLEAVGIKPVTCSIQHYLKSQVTPNSGFDFVLNCASQSRSMYGLEEPGVDFKCNVESAFATAEVCRITGASLIHWSTNKVYSQEQVLGFPEGINQSTVCDMRGSRTVYGATKLAAEVLLREWAHAYGVKTLINRFSCLSGPHQWGCVDQGWVARWVINHYLDLPLQYCGFGGYQVRDVLHIHDLCRLIPLQMDYMNKVDSHLCTVSNVGGGIANRLSLVACTALCRTLMPSTKTEITQAPMRYADQEKYVTSVKILKSLYRWKPVISAKETVESVYQWVKENDSQIREFYCA